MMSIIRYDTLYAGSIAVVVVANKNGEERNVYILLGKSQSLWECTKLGLFLMTGALVIFVGAVFGGEIVNLQL